jgi:hypothetical protein
MVFAILLAMLNGCSYFDADRDEPVMARVQDEFLYLSDITGQIPSGMTPRDSLSMAKTITNHWVQQQMLTRQASENISEEQLDFEEKIENYRNALLIHKYESQLIQQKADINITLQDIESYYEANKANYVLEKDILKINYIMLPLTYSKTAEARRIFFDSDNTQEIEAYCKENNLQFFLEPVWIYLEQVAQVLPMRVTSVNSISYSKAEREDEKYRYLLKIKGTRAVNEIKPLEFVSAQIRNILVNQRKSNFLKKMREDIVEKGFKNNEIEIY